MNAEQGSPEWHAERLGKITASQFRKVMTKPSTKSATWADGAITYADELVAERLTGNPRMSGGTAATQWGHDHEEPARQEYEAAQRVPVDLAGFVPHPFVENAGGSPDGYVGELGLIEIKCPYNSANHIATVRAGAMPAEHTAQVQGLLWITAREWCDFVSFDPRMPDGCRLFMARVERDQTYIDGLASRVEAFAQYVTELEGRLRG